MSVELPMCEYVVDTSLIAFEQEEILGELADLLTRHIRRCCDMHDYKVSRILKDHGLMLDPKEMTRLRHLDVVRKATS